MPFTAAAGDAESVTAQSAVGELDDTTGNGSVSMCRAAAASATSSPSCGQRRRGGNVAQVFAGPVVGRRRRGFVAFSPQADHENDGGHDRHKHSDADGHEHVSRQGELHSAAPYAGKGHAVHSDSSGA